MTVIPFPRPPLDPETAPRLATGHAVVRCGGVLHVFGSVPSRCQCGERFWDGTIDPDDDASARFAGTGQTIPFPEGAA